MFGFDPYFIHYFNVAADFYRLWLFILYCFVSFTFTSIGKETLLIKLVKTAKQTTNRM